jgi:predicted ATP-grasp superfamily ATP-dependent carboligase
MAALISVGGVDFPTPSEYSIGIQDIKKAERNTRARIISELIATKAKIELSWKYVTQAQLTSILSAVAPNEFSVTYFNSETGLNRTATFYAGDRTVGMIDFIGGVGRYKDLKFNLIEC